MTNIYRAANNAEGRFWMMDRDDAIAYLNNGYLGGDTLFVAKINLDSLLDLTNSAVMYNFLDLVLGDDWSAKYPDYTDALELPVVIAEVKTYGKVGILYQDNFPPDAEALFVWDGIIGIEDSESSTAKDSVRDITWQEIENLSWDSCFFRGRLSWDNVAKALRIDKERINYINVDDDEMTISIINLDGTGAVEGIIEKS